MTALLHIPRVHVDRAVNVLRQRKTLLSVNDDFPQLGDFRPLQLQLKPMIAAEARNRGGAGTENANARKLPHGKRLSQPLAEMVRGFADNRLGGSAHNKPHHR